MNPQKGSRSMTPPRAHHPGAPATVPECWASPSNVVRVRGISSSRLAAARVGELIRRAATTAIPASAQRLRVLIVGTRRAVGSTASNHDVAARTAAMPYAEVDSNSRGYRAPDAATRSSSSLHAPACCQGLRALLAASSTAVERYWTPQLSANDRDGTAGSMQQVVTDRSK